MMDDFPVLDLSLIVDFLAIDFSLTSDFLAVDFHLTDDLLRQVSPSLHLVALVAPNGVRQSQFVMS